MRELVSIKVKIGLRENGHAKYPEFNRISSSIRKNMDWSKFVDVYGLGWQYDRTSGHRDDTPDSPFGQQWGVLIIPKDFADEAVRMFPNECSKIIEQELEKFYDEKVHIYDKDEEIDEKVLAGIKAKQDLGFELTDTQMCALDPDNHEVPGIRKNMRKKWKDFKKVQNIEIIQ